MLNKEKLLEWLELPLDQSNDYEEGYRDAILDVVEKINSGVFDTTK